MCSVAGITSESSCRLSAVAWLIETTSLDGATVTTGRLAALGKALTPSVSSAPTPVAAKASATASDTITRLMRFPRSFTVGYDP